MTQKITPLDLALKLSMLANQSRTKISKSELVEIYIGDCTHPWIVSEHTFNEKIRLMCSLKLLTKVAGDVYAVDWGQIAVKIEEWRGVINAR